jgi:16S rRNA processing protein RimM
MENRVTWILLAHLLRPQGRKGELLADLYTDFPEQFEVRSRIYLAAPNFEGQKSEAREMDVTSFWLPVGKNQGRVVIKLAGVDSISDAEKLAGQELIIPQEERTPLEDDTNYISDLINCTVYDRGAAIGTIEDVQFATTPDGGRRLAENAPILVVSATEGDEILIPFVKDFLVDINVKEKRVNMALPAGLLDVNR